MVLVLKIVICILLLAITLTGYVVFNMFNSSFKTEDYENSSLMGKLLNQLLFIMIASGLTSLFAFLSVVLFSDLIINV